MLSTGQHEQMVGEIFALAGITVDAHLWVGGARSRLNERVATLMRRIEDYVIGRYADLQGEKATRELIVAGAYPLTVIVHGDTSSAFAAALASFHLRIPVVHVEAGLRTGGLNLTPFPEELNRQLITCIAAMHLAPTAKNEENLVRENVSADQIFVTGNTGIDALHWAAGLDVPIARSAASPQLVEDDDRDRRRDRPPPGELGRRPRGHRRGGRARRDLAPGRAVRPPDASEPRRSRASCVRRSSRSRTCCWSSRSATRRWPS